MSILYFANSVRDFDDSLISASTDSRLGDSNYVPYPFPMVGTNENDVRHTHMIFDGASELDDEIWFHIRMGFWVYMYTATSGAAGTDTQIEFRDENDNIVFELCTVAAAVSVRARGDTNVTASSSVTIVNTSVKHVLDLKMVVSAATIEITLNISNNSGTLLDTVTATADNTVGNKGPIKKAFAQWYNWRDGSYVHGLGFTEIIVTNGEPTIGWRLASTKAVVAGQYSQWLGDWEDVEGFWQDARFLAASESGIRESWGVSAYAGATVNYEIRGVGMFFKGEKGHVAGPQSAHHMIVVDGKPYEGPEIALNGSPTFHRHVWDINPNTEVAWDFLELDALEVGVRSGT